MKVRFEDGEYQFFVLKSGGEWLVFRVWEYDDIDDAVRDYQAVLGDIDDVWELDSLNCPTEIKEKIVLDWLLDRKDSTDQFGNCIDGRFTSLH